MKKFLVVPIAAMTLAAGCGDLATAPSSFDDFTQSTTGGQLSQSELWRAGNSSTWHGYDAPELTWQDGRACVRWTDARVFDMAQDESGANPDHYSFEFKKLGEDGYEEYLKLNNADGDWICSDDPFEDGDYTLTGMAKAGKGQTTSTHHTLTHEFSVGGTYSIVAVGGNCKTGSAPNANTSTWNITLQLYYGGVLVDENHPDLYANGTLMNFDDDDNKYHVNAQGMANQSSLTWDFNVGSADGPSAGSFTCVAPTTTARGRN